MGFLRKYASLALLTACTWSVCVICASLLVAVRPAISRRRYRRLVGALAQTPWIRACFTLLPIQKLRLTGEMTELATAESSAGALVIANHQVDADGLVVWAFLDMLAASHPANGGGRGGWYPHECFFSPLSGLKILLKADLINVPIFGWGMWFFEYVFLARNWQKDRKPLISKLSSFREDGLAPHVLIFPEGTTLNKRTQDKGNAYAEARGRPTFTHLISPRTTGFHACLEAMTHGPAPAAAKAASNGSKGSKGSKGSQGSKGSNGRREDATKYPAVYDLTVAYDGYRGEVPPWDLGFEREVDKAIGNLDAFMSGTPQPCISIDFRRHEGRSVGGADDGFLDGLWVRKERLLRAFAKEQRFPAEEVGPARELRVAPCWGTVARLLLVPWVITPVVPIVAAFAWPIGALRLLLGVLLALPRAVAPKPKRA